MTILNLLLDLIDSLSLLSSLNPCALYPGEFLYWRLGGIILLAFVPGVWLFSGMLGDTACVAASIISGHLADCSSGHPFQPCLPLRERTI